MAATLHLLGTGVSTGSLRDSLITSSQIALYEGRRFLTESKVLLNCLASAFEQLTLRKKKALSSYGGKISVEMNRPPHYRRRSPSSARFSTARAGALPDDHSLEKSARGVRFRTAIPESEADEDPREGQ